MAMHVFITVGYINIYTKTYTWLFD